MDPVLSFLFISLACYLAGWYFWSRRHLYAAARQYGGPIALPVLGNALYLYGKNEEILSKIYHLVQRYEEQPFRMWLGSHLILIFSDPSHVEKILSSSKFAHKHEIYSLLNISIGVGLVTGSGPTHKAHRRLIQPMFNIKFSENCIGAFQKHIDICITKLDAFVDKGTFDVEKIIHSCFTDIIGETVLGCDFDTQLGRNKDYAKAFIDVYDLKFTRLVKPWMHPNVIYNFSGLKVVTEKVRGLIRVFLKRVIKEAWGRRKLVEEEPKEFPPIIDQIAQIIEENPGTMCEEGFLDHLATLFVASEDTLSSIVSFACVCFGMYPEYQEKAVQEILTVFGEEPRTVTLLDMNRLNYLDMCIKDVIRLAPIAPYIVRRNLQDCEIGKWKLPKGCGVLVPIFNLHRDKRYWEKPFHFHPDHFLPEVVKTRPTFSFLPFSAGPRGCIGKILANTGLKVALVSILLRYEIEAKGKFPDLNIKMDISVRATDGLNVSLKRRSFKM